MSYIDEFDKLVEKAAYFPSLDGRFAALENHVNSLGEFIEVTCDQTEIRLKAHANKEKDPVTQAEIESEVWQLQNGGRSEFSSIICGSVLVSVYFTYEASIVNIFDHMARNSSLVLFENFKRKQANRIKKENNGKVTFLLSADAYSCEVLGLSLFGTHTGYFAVEELRRLRNSYVHNGCTLDGISEKTKNNIFNGKYERALGYLGSKWYVTPVGVSIFFKETYDSFKYFQRQAFAKTITEPSIQPVSQAIAVNAVLPIMRWHIL